MKNNDFWNRFLRSSAYSLGSISCLLTISLGLSDPAKAQVISAANEEIEDSDFSIASPTENAVLPINTFNPNTKFVLLEKVELSEPLSTVQASLSLANEVAPDPSLETSFTQADLLNQGVGSTDQAILSSANEVAVDPTIESALAQDDVLSQGMGVTNEMPWRFSIEPFFYIPLWVNGDVTVRGINASINAGPSDTFSTIVNDLNFAAFGRAEAWKGPWGIFFSGAYMNLGTGRTATIPVPPVLQQAGLPPQATLSAAAGTSFVQLDLGGAYRFGDGNLPTALRTANTEFDLGPFIFDAMAGARFYSFSNSLALTGPLANSFEFGQSRTILEPMIGGRARWNLSHNLAALVGGTMSGFGIGDLTFSTSGYAGIDWLFSGNTSLMASYGFTYLDYSSGNSGLNLFTHGPSIGVKFRF